LTPLEDEEESSEDEKESSASLFLPPNLVTIDETILKKDMQAEQTRSSLNQIPTSQDGVVLNDQASCIISQNLTNNTDTSTHVHIHAIGDQQRGADLSKPPTLPPKPRKAPTLAKKPTLETLLQNKEFNDQQKEHLLKREPLLKN
jgi:hypothetical protein